MRTRWLKNLTVIKPCWLCLLLPNSAATPELDAELKDLGYIRAAGKGALYALKTHTSWYLEWKTLAPLIDRHGLAKTAHIAITPGEDCPSWEDAELHQAEVGEVATTSEQTWLIEALENGQLACQFHPVVDKRGTVFGYESLVRAKREDGSTANGGHIFNASRIMRIEHLIDRHLHELSIRSFAAQKLTGFLFINLLPGFIQRPEFYLGGLGEACRAAGVQPKQVVLDCTNSENPRDIQHLKAIFNFCREQGYLCSLDDIESTGSVRRIFREMSPDFIKLDMRLVHRLHEPEAMETVRELVAFTQGTACTLIAEGVEDQQMQDTLASAGVNLFQGYLYAAPEQVFLTPAPAAKKTTSSKTINPPSSAAQEAK